MNIFLFIFGGLCIFYDFTLIILNSGTFLDNLTSFTHIWSFLGGFHIFLGIYRIKTGKSFWKNLRKWVKLTIGSLVTLGLSIAIVSFIFILTPSVLKNNESCDYVILLGGGIDKNGVLPKQVINRVEKAAAYLQINENATCVVTGGTLKWLPFAEAPEIKRQLIKHGVNEKRILVEDQALDTIQNFQLSVELISKTEKKTYEEILNSKIVVVTSFYHLRRAERLASRLGFTNLKGLASRCPPFFVLHCYVREICAYIKLNLRILLTGEPRELV